MHKYLFRSLTALLLLNLPCSAALPDPEFAKGPFPVAGSLAGVRVEQAASDLGSVTGITHVGDGRLFVTIRDGRILVLENGTVRSTFLDIRSLVTTVGEGGLLSTAFHPKYGQNGLFFVNYTNTSGDTVIARYQVSGSDPNRADPASASILLLIDQPFSNHNGGQLQFGPDGYLYIGMGDGGAAFDPACRAQKPGELLGKMLRIDVDQNVNSAPFYGIPADNPFRGPGDPRDEVWASGLRNPWRFSFDRETGDLWIGDVGQNQREEIDFQPANSRGGENYGWKVMEGTACLSADSCPASTPGCNSSAFTPPVLEYNHGPHCSITGGYVYRGNGIGALKGSYVFGDFCSGTLWAASRQGSGFTVRTIPAQISQLTTFGEDAAGELYAATLTGRLYKFSGEAGGGGGGGGGGGNPKAETVGLYDPQASKFQLKAANTAGAKVQVVRFGPRRSTWLPIAGDWDGNGTATIGLYDPATGTFRLENSLSGGAADVLLQVDSPSRRALPLAGDWNGDGRDTVGLYDVDTGRFLLKNSLTGSGFDLTFSFGPAGQARIPLSGDWDGNGSDGVGLFDPSGSVFTLANSFTGGGPDLQFQFGPAGRDSLPVSGDWNGDGTDGVGVYDPASAVFRLKNALSAGNPDLQFRFGPRRGGWRPIAGAW
ncbi:MAG TPA: PQQ-dependent sugar dehydrogenase [Thermoanaerobaculia bacterium]|jgi:glucose/arabinose dehydrogenase|nr:PQQ-dependent sugar dehydrogenase [Thermoanaerobaculia bacterium]